MKLITQCERCSASLEVDAADIGRAGDCPICGELTVLNQAAPVIRPFNPEGQARMDALVAKERAAQTTIFIGYILAFCGAVAALALMLHGIIPLLAGLGLIQVGKWMRPSVLRKRGKTV